MRHHPILNYLRQALGTVAGGVSDAELLCRFVAKRDEAAFELLLWRHAAMVLHVCRQMLGDAHAAEDAFQATFLVFVRKAGSISRREALGSWLYRVAYRICLKARVQLRKGPSACSELERLAGPETDDDASQRELRRLICEEVDRLPAKYRAPIVACFFAGKTHEEAAHQLGWPRGTVAGRLARARELLRRRLLRRGVAFSMSALVTVLSVRTAQAALAGLVDSVIHTTRLMTAGQAAGAVVSPHVAALAEGVMQAMYWTRMKILMGVLLIAAVGGAGASLWATQRRAAEPPGKTPPPVWGTADLALAGGSSVSASEDEEERPAVDPYEGKSPEDKARLARAMARSRLNLKKLAVAMHAYNDTYHQLPLVALTDKNGKAGLSWRVALLPFLGEQELYRQFHLDEPWDSPHNKKLLSKMPAVFAPPGVKTQRPFSTFYQVFVSTGSGGGGMPGAGGAMMPGMQGGPGPAGRPGMQPPGGVPAMPRGGGQSAMGGANPPAGGSSMPRATGGPPQPGGFPGGMGAPGGNPAGAGSPPANYLATPFIKGEATSFPASIPDGTSNTILIVEAGNPVPWTKPEDLHYADDEPLPELGGLFADVFHAVFADGEVHTLTRNYNQKQLRLAITANDGMPFDLAKIEARLPRRARAGDDRAGVEAWQRKNEELRKDLERIRQQIQLLKEEQEVERELAGEDPRVNQLKDEHARMRAELRKLQAEIEALKKDLPSRKPRHDEE